MAARSTAARSTAARSTAARTMVAHTMAAPPTPWSKNLAEPQIDGSAYVHSFSNLIGDVKVGPKVLVAPGTSIRADEGAPFYIGEGTNIQDGVVIHGLERGRVVGDDGREYSVWIGKHNRITHMALIHGPAYIGNNSFIGFRSTVFNARIGEGCIIMMHTLIQDVEIPSGKYVPSGSIVTTQQQADRLPDVNNRDRLFTDHIVEINEALRVGYQDSACLSAASDQQASIKESTETPYENSVTPMNTTTSLRDQVHSLLAQGFKVGVEHADKRRFKTSSWLSCGTITGQREEQVIHEIESFLRDYEGEYIRLIGIDPQAKRRVLESIIQRPGETPAHTTASSGNGHYRSPSSSNQASQTGNNGQVNSNVRSHLRSLIERGLKIGTEYANQRRFKTSSWQTGPTLEGHQENAVIRELEAVIAEHPNEYVRVVGIDPQAKRRVLELIVQRPGERVNLESGSSHSPTAYRASSSSHRVGSPIKTGLASDAISQVRSLLAQGYKIGTEHADKRRFKTSSWQSCTPIESNRESEVMAALEDCIAQHQGEYVRLLGIDPKAKRRVLETIIARPDEKAQNVARPVSESFSSTSSYSSPTTSKPSSYGNNRLSPEVVAQVRSLLAQGHKIGMEHADKRRFRTSSWQSCTPIESNREADVFAALENCVAEHQGEYVRLLGIDSQAKRRVAETIIQRP